MLIVIPTYWLTATIGDQHLQLRIPDTELKAVLDVLHFNQASEVRYVLEVIPDAQWMTSVSHTKVE